MRYPVLDETVKKALNELTKEEVNQNTSYGYGHEILWYGVDAVIHTHLMRMARDVSKRKLPLDKFIETYGLESRRTRILVDLERIETDGIFIPRHTTRGKVHLFHSDYLNRVYFWDAEKDYAKQLIERKWELSDLENLELVEQGIRFGRDMWASCVKGFERKRETPQPIKVTDLGRELISYYDKIVNAPNQ